MKQRKLWVLSIIGTGVAGVVCVAPAIILLVLGAGAVTAIPPWLDFVIVPVFVLSTGMAYFLWHRDRKKSPTQPD